MDPLVEKLEQELAEMGIRASAAEAKVAEAQGLIRRLEELKVEDHRKSVAQAQELDELRVRRFRLRCGLRGKLLAVAEARVAELEAQLARLKAFAALLLCVHEHRDAETAEKIVESHLAEVCETQER